MSVLILIVKLVFAAGGLTLPGHAVARALGVRPAWPAAFPLSALLLTELVIACSGTGIPLQFRTMAPLLAGVTLAGYLLARRRVPCSGDPAPDDDPETAGALKWSALVLAGLILLAVTVRTTLYPLSGYDTFWRWDALARAMFSQETLSFYPPVTAVDYGKYFFADGIPPLAATVYWWIYAALGSPVEQATSLSVMLQLASTMALTFFAARYSAGSRGGYAALVVLCTTTLLIDGFAIGQETGFLALSVAGQLCFAWRAVRKPEASPIVAAALCASVGALTRDYAPALALIGITVLASKRHTRRSLPLFILSTAVLSAPWYVRSWILTGNPLYSHAILPGLPVNPVHVTMMNSYKEFNSLSQVTWSTWWEVAFMLVTTAPLAIFGGVGVILARWRSLFSLAISIVLIVFLWLWSVPQTNVGIFYSLRVLCPAFIVLSVAVGMAVEAWHVPIRRFGILPWRMAMAGVGMVSLYAVISTAAYPNPPRDLFSTFTSRHAGPPETCINQVTMTDTLNASEIPSTGVLTDDQYFAVLLSRGSRFRPVMTWSPEVAYLFDPAIGMDEISRRLRSQNITLVSVEISPNNLFLSRNRFYANELPHWEKVRTIDDQFVVYAVPPL